MNTGCPEVDGSTAEWVIGSDEVGYGAWAGPLVICATLVPRAWTASGVGDSKKLSAAQRSKVYDRYFNGPIARHMVSVSNERIDQMGVGRALHEAHGEALRKLIPMAPGPVLVVVDGYKDGTHAIGVPQAIGLPKADDLVPAVSLASIFAKVTRDAIMVAYELAYPGYGFQNHKGYGTPEHQKALERLGPCAIHRKSYGPIRQQLPDLAGLTQARETRERFIEDILDTLE